MRSGRVFHVLVIAICLAVMVLSGSITVVQNPSQPSSSYVGMAQFVGSAGRSTTAGNTSIVGVGSNPMGVVYDSSNGDIYVANEEGNSVSVISAANNTVMATIQGCDSPLGVGFDNSTNVIFATNVGGSNVTAISGVTNQVITTIPTGTTPWAVAYDGSNEDVYVANSGSNNVTVISGTTYRAIASVAVGIGPFGIAWDSATGEMFVAEHGAGSPIGGDNVSVINTTTNTLVATIGVGSSNSAGPWSGPFGMAFDNSNGDIYVVNEHTDNVSVISGTTLSVVANINVGDEPYEMAYDNDNGDIFVTNHLSGDLTVISGLSNSVVGTVAVGSGPYGIAYAGPVSSLYVANQGSNDVSIIPEPVEELTIKSFAPSVDPVGIGQPTWLNLTASGGVGNLTYSYSGLPLGCLSSDTPNLECAPSANGSFTVEVRVNDSVGHVAYANTSLQVISPSTNPIEVGSDPMGVAFDDANSNVYVADSASNTTSVISTSDNEVIGTIPVGAGPLGVGVDNSTDVVFVTNSGSSNVSVISGVTNKVIGTIPAGATPWAVAYDSSNGDVYVANWGSDNVTIISGTTYRAIASVAVGTGPYGIAWDSATGDLFVANHGAGSAAGGDSVSVIDGATNLVVATIPVGSSTLWSGPFGITYDSEDGNVYVVNEHTDNVSVISGSTLSVIANIEVGDEPYDVAYDSDTGDVFVSLHESADVAVISGFTEQVTGIIGAGYGPYGLAYATSDSGLYVANQLSNNVSAITVPFSPPTIASVSVSANPLTEGTTTFLNVTASGGVGSLSYAYIGLPQGCSSEDSSSLNCTPTTYGNFSVQVQVKDSVGHFALFNLTLVVVQSGPFTVTFTVSPNPPVANKMLTITAAVTGGIPPYTYTYAGLPPGCSSQNVPSLTCTPTASGTYPISLTVTDSAHHSSSSAENITVRSATVNKQTTTYFGLSLLELVAVAVVVIGGALVLLLATVRYRRQEVSRSLGVGHGPSHTGSKTSQLKPPRPPSGMEALGPDEDDPLEDMI